MNLAQLYVNNWKAGYQSVDSQTDISLFSSFPVQNDTITASGEIIQNFKSKKSDFEQKVCSI